MYISKIRIKNFRNLKDFEIELKPFTTIIGENNFFRVIVIEELEAHLCPIVQKHLAENLTAEEVKGKQQILVTTHSTHIASYLELKNTVVMFKNGNRIDNHYLLEGFNENASKDRRSIRYLQKWLNVTNSTMFLQGSSYL